MKQQLKIERVKTSDLILDSNNARSHPQKNLDTIRNSIAKFGVVDPLIVQKNTNVVVSGNGRLQVLRELGHEETDVIYIDINNTEFSQLSLLMNRSSELAEWNMETLGIQLQALREDGFELEELGFELDDLKEFNIDNNINYEQFETNKEKSDNTNEIEEIDKIEEINKEDIFVKYGDVFEYENKKIFCGDSLDILKNLQDNSIDSLVTDPPAGISFMGKDWDSDKGGSKEWINWLSQIMTEVKRVLKPGGHGLVWTIPRTSHWTAMALEMVGFEIRDVITHVFGSGFPKSLDISKAIDKHFGYEREIIGKNNSITSYTKNNFKKFTEDGRNKEPNIKDVSLITAPSTQEAKQYEGFGTALKPASEHWILIRKPISENSIAENVLKYGTGGINIDGCRIQAIDQNKLENNWNRQAPAGFGGGLYKGKLQTENIDQYKKQGRFPANFILSHHEECEAPTPFPDGSVELNCHPECPVKILDEQSGNLKSGCLSPINNIKESTGWNGGSYSDRVKNIFLSNEGGASRFFYCAKASKSERNAGCKDNQKNIHPTVKPIKLIEYLSKMITPPNGIILDCFSGSGTLLLAAERLGFGCIIIDKEPEYIQISLKRFEGIIKKKIF